MCMEVIYTRYSYIFYLTAYEGFGSAALVVLPIRAGTVRFCPRSCPEPPVCGPHPARSDPVKVY